MSGGVYSFNSDKAKDRIKAIMKVIRDAAPRPVGSKEISNTTGMHPTTVCTYLTGMHHQLALITPSARQGQGNGLYWIEGADPKIDDDSGTSGRPIIKLTKAAEYSGPIPVDPMRAYLFGTGRAA